MRISPSGWFLIRVTKYTMNKTIQYLKEVKAEMNNITWPTRNQTIFYTITVLVISVLIAYYLGLLDFGFSAGLSKILIK